MIFPGEKLPLKFSVYKRKLFFETPRHCGFTRIYLKNLLSQLQRGEKSRLSSKPENLVKVTQKTSKELRFSLALCNPFSFDVGLFDTMKNSFLFAANDT